MLLGRRRAGRVPFPLQWVKRRRSRTRSSCGGRARSSRAGPDFTVAVEEEFVAARPGDALARQPVRGAEGGGQGVGGRPAPRRRADRVRGRGAHRPLRGVRRGRGDDGRAPRAAAGRSRSGSDLALGATGTHPWSRWQDQRIIDTPHYRRNDELLRLRGLAQQHVRPPRSRRDPRRRPGDRGAQRAASVPADLLALSASSPFVEGVNSGLHSARTEIFTRMFPRCGVPDAYGDWTSSRATSASSTRPSRSTSTRSSGGASARTSPSRPSRSGSATPSPSSPRPVRWPRSPTRSPRGSLARSTRASRCPRRRSG